LVVIKDEGNGRHCVTLTYPEPGVYRVSCSFAGTYSGPAGPIRGSPFAITISPPPSTPSEKEGEPAVPAGYSLVSPGLLPGGDAVVRLWGEDRAAQSMATRTMLEEGIPFTFSHDAPVSPEPWILTLVSCGVNRTTPSGRVIGPDQRIPPYAALRAVTAMAAWEIKEETTKGTLEPGKLADLVILEKNPLEVPSDTIGDIAVLETIKEGKTIWCRGEK
jgi:hypothetical protein